MNYMDTEEGERIPIRGLHPDEYINDEGEIRQTTPETDLLDNYPMWGAIDDLFKGL